MKIGDLVLYQGRPHYLRGLDPMGVPDRQVFLEDAETGQEVRVPLADVEPDGPSGALGAAGV